MAKQQSKPSYSNQNYPKSMAAGGSKVGRQREAQLEAVVAEGRRQAIARQQATANAMPQGPSNVDYVQYHDAQQNSLPKPGETQSE